MTDQGCNSNHLANFPFVILILIKPVNISASGFCLFQSIQGRRYTGLNARPFEEGRALAHIIGRYNMNQTMMIVDDDKLADGFLNGIRTVTNDGQRDVFGVLPLDKHIR